MIDLSLLPELLLLSDFGGDYARYEEAVYGRFQQDFVLTRLQFQGKRMGLKKHPLLNDKEATFWHFTSEGQVETERIPDMRRYERIAWPRHLIENSQASHVRYWRNQRGIQDNVLLAVEDFSYLLVLQDRGDYLLPWTAYCVEREHQRAKHRREYEAYVTALKVQTPPC